jgi:prophage regulatory protein
VEARILRLNDLRKLLNLHKSTIYRLIEKKEFPAPIQLGPNSVGWLREEIDEWIGSRPRATEMSSPTA